MNVAVLIFLYCFDVFFAFASTGSNVTFQNVTIKFYDYLRGSQSVKIISANNLVEYLGDHNLVIIDNQDIPVLYDNSINGVNVADLLIVRCNLREIKPKAFLQAEIRNLKIKENNLEKIASETFAHMEFSILSLDRNDIKVVEPGAFLGSRIDVLSFEENKLEEVAEGYFANSSISTLYLNNNNIKKIAPGAFKNVTKLRFLYLKNNQLEEISDGFTDLPDILAITVMNNNITKLEPGVFRNTFVSQKKSTLGLDYNKISLIKRGVFNNLALYDLSLSFNEITCIEKGAFDNMPNIQQIDLSFNKLKGIQDGIFNNKDMTALNLRGNEIAYIQPEAFRNFSVTVLDLGLNNFTEIRKHAFKNASLYALYLFRNKINNLEPGAFEGGHIWSTLDLSYNKLDEISEGVFNVPLKIVDLQNNHVRKIHGTVGDGSGETIVYLAGNPVDTSTLNFNFTME